ncbi:MAG: glycogen synthase [Gemmatimonadetes bacterium]|nr:glycogen synthase [Gemmatimonadota bacterium]
MNVLFVAAEVDPWIKTGGLADVAGALPAALRSIGHDVRVVMPRYRVLREKGIPSDGPIAASFLTIGERAEEQRVWRLSASAAPTYLLDIPAAFERAAIYGESDDHRRFVLFARGVLDLMQHLREVEGWQPDVVHCHDWHAALVPNYLRTTMGYTFGHIATVFTIHNLAYQGFAPPATLSLAGLSEGGSLEDVLGGRFAGTFNFMARGIVHSDIISTVSPTYAGEIMTPEYGEGLDGVLRSRRDRMVGILNGIDAMVFDPFTDPSIAAPYRPDNMAGKGQCKAALQRETGLPVAPDRALLGVVSRLVEQKGFDLLEAVMPWLLRETDAQLVLLGSGQANWETLFHRYAATYPDRVSARDRLRRVAGATHLRRERHVPHALALRTVRAGADDRPALRQRSHRARHRGAQRHRERGVGGERLPFPSVRGALLRRRHRACPRRVSQQRGVGDPPRARDARGQLLGPRRQRLRAPVSGGGEESGTIGVGRSSDSRERRA